MKAFATVLALLFAVSAPVWGQTSSDDDLRPVQPLYVIAANDMLEIFVWQEPNLSREVLVRPDGRISVPLLQDLQAAGLTAPELATVIEAGLEQYISAPNVTVIVKAIRNYRIYVTGKVNNPGVFTVEQPVSILQAISMAGGLAEYADEGDIKIHRNYGRENVIFEFHYGKVIKGEDVNQNIILRSGDLVVVP